MQEGESKRGREERGMIACTLGWTAMLRCYE